MEDEFCELELNNYDYQINCNKIPTPFSNLDINL